MHGWRGFFRVILYAAFRLLVIAHEGLVLLIQVVVLDGKNGSTIWSIQSSEKEMSSALVARTTQAYHDVFVFRVGGQLNLNSDLPKTQVIFS